jgi:hypothetical protein
MRVGETKGAQGRSDTSSAVRFDDALRRARGTEVPPPVRSVARRAGAQGAGELEREAAGAPGRVGVHAALATEPARSAFPGDLAPVPEIAALVRTVPAAIALARQRDGASLSLSMGHALDVELRAGPGGVDVVLRPEPPLARAAEAELPRVVAALRVRGVVVGRAEVRTRGAPHRRRAR